MEQIRVLCQAGYFDHALMLARQHQDHEWYMRTQLDRPTPDLEDALKCASPILSSTTLLPLSMNA